MNASTTTRARAGLLALAALLVLAAGCSGVGSPTHAAVVNGVTITVAELEEEFAAVAASPQYQQQAAQTDPADLERQATAGLLTQFVQQALFEQAAADLGIEVSDADVAERLAQLIEEEFGGQEAFDALVEQQGLTAEEVDEQVRLFVIQERLNDELVGGAEISEQDVQDAYDAQYAAPTVRHILVATEAEAEDVLERLEDGEDFAALAQELSTDPGSGAQGGDLGPFQEGMFVPEFEAAVLDAEPGEVVGPVETQFGFHVIEVLPPAPLEDVREEIEQGLADQAGAAELQALQADLIAEADVEVNPRFGRWDPQTGQVVPADPLGDVRPVDPAQDALDEPTG